MKYFWRKHQWTFASMNSVCSRRDEFCLFTKRMYEPFTFSSTLMSDVDYFEQIREQFVLNNLFWFLSDFNKAPHHEKKKKLEMRTHLIILQDSIIHGDLMSLSNYKHKLFIFLAALGTKPFWSGRTSGLGVRNNSQTTVVKYSAPST